MVRGKTTNQKLREIIIRQYSTGKTIRKISDDLSIPKTTVFNIIKKYGESANVDVRGKSSGRPKVVSQRDLRNLVKICKSARRSTLREVTVKWNTVTGLNISRECCRKYIHKCGLGFYKVNFILCG